MNRKQRRATPSKVRATLNNPSIEIWVGFAIVPIPKEDQQETTGIATSSQEVLAMLSTAKDKDTARMLASRRTPDTSKVFAIQAHTSPDVKKLTDEISEILTDLKVAKVTHVEWTIKILAALSTLFKLVLDKK